MAKLGSKRRQKARVELPSEGWNAYIATPAYDGKVDTDYAMSLGNAMWYAPVFEVQATACVMANGAFIDLARNIFVKQFLEDHTDCTHLFFIDADLKFPHEAFIGLIRSGHEICAGAYRRRQEEEDYPVRWEPHPEEGGLWVEDDWVMASRVPTGFLCISRKVLEEMAADAVQMNIKGQDGPVPRLFYTKLDEENRMVGEDFCFCDDYVAKYGKPIPVWTNIDFTHGGYECNLNDYLERMIEGEESPVSAA